VADLVDASWRNRTLLAEWIAGGAFGDRRAWLRHPSHVYFAGDGGRDEGGAIFFQVGDAGFDLGDGGIYFGRLAVQVGSDEA